MYLAKIYVTLKPTVNDPQGQTVLAGLRNLSFHSVAGVRMGKYLEITVREGQQEEAERAVQGMCRQLLANPVIEDFRYELEELASET